MRNKFISFVIYLVIPLMMAPVLSYFSGFFTVRVSDAEIDTVGTIAYRGFPVWFYEQADGISIMSGWHLDRFKVNTSCWLVVTILIIPLYQKMQLMRKHRLSFQ